MAFRAIFLTVLASLLTACSSSPVIYDEDRRASAEMAVKSFSDDERLAPFF